MEFYGCTWAEVDLAALVNNFQAVKAHYGAGRKMLSVVKTDAYGHGTVPVAQALARAGSDGFCVSGVPEAEELRSSGITQPVLILGYTPAGCAPRLARGNISQCVFSLDYARQLNDAAREAGVRVAVHLKLDTGMGRIGFDCRSEGAVGLQEARQLLQMENLQVEGVFMHFATADSEAAADREYARQQADRFWQAVGALEAMGFAFTYKHCCNSAAAVMQEPMGNAIRPGIILYGVAPAEDVPLLPEFQPVMSLYSTVSLVKILRDGQSVNYGRTYIAPGDRKIATVSAGYGDGVPRLLSGQGHVLIRGRRAPIVGRVCMDQLCVDVTDIADVQMGDRVTVFGPGLPVDEVAAQAQTIAYEILCGITKRVRRVYK